MSYDREHPAGHTDENSEGLQHEIALESPRELETIQVSGEVVRQLGDRRANLKDLRSGHGMVSEYLDQLDPLIRPQMIELLEQEIDALETLDPFTVTLEEVYDVCRSFRERSEALNPNKP